MQKFHITVNAQFIYPGRLCEHSFKGKQFILHL